MTLRRAKNIFKPTNIYCTITNIISKIATEKNEESREYASFQLSKIFILAHKIRHNARQRDNNNITDIQTASKCANFFLFLSRFEENNEIVRKNVATDQRMVLF